MDQLKMLSSLMLSLFFNIIILATSHEGVKDQITVAPSSVSECSGLPCLTWDECLRNTSRCFESHSSVTFLPGKYIIHNPITLEGRDSLNIQGVAKKDGSSLGHNLVNLDCQYSRGGIMFVNITDLVLSTITLSRCGFVVATNYWSVQTRSKNPTYPFNITTAMYIIECFNVQLRGVVVTDSLLSGVSCINCLGTSSIVNSVITRSNFQLIRRMQLHNFSCPDQEKTGEFKGHNVRIVFRSLLYSTPHHYFTMNNTKISYGAQLSDGPLCCGMSVYFYQHNYLVHLSVLNSDFFGNLGCQLGIMIAFNHLVYTYVADSTFTSANIISDNDTAQLVPETITQCHDRDSSIVIGALNWLSHSLTSSCSMNSTSSVTLERIKIIDNLGGALLTTNVPGEADGCQFNVTIRNSIIADNHRHRQLGSLLIGIIEIRGTQRQPQSIVLFLHNVEVRNNSISFDRVLGERNLYKFASAILVITGIVHLSFTGLINNSMTAIATYEGEMHLHENDSFIGNTGVCGGAILLDSESVIVMYPGADILIANNTALTYGAGICVDNGQVSETSSCVFEIAFARKKLFSTVDMNLPKVRFQYNTAAITGHFIYGWSFPCYETTFWFEVHASQYNLSWPSAVPLIGQQLFFKHVFHSKHSPTMKDHLFSSTPVTAKFCFKHGNEFAPRVERISHTLYPGQKFQVRAVGIGMSGVILGITPAVISPRIRHPDRKVSVLPEFQSLPNHCEYLNYTLFAPEGLTGIIVSLSVRGIEQLLQEDVQLNLTTLPCPTGFVFDNTSSSCLCSSIFKAASVQCSVDAQTFIRSGSVWIGVTSSGILLSHGNCPSTYCRTEQTELTLAGGDTQCASNHSGILCGGCQKGYSMVLGSPRCRRCSDVFILLVFVFAALGVALVLCLSKLNITVATGELNGFLLYANVIKASSNAFTSFPYLSRVFLLPLAWLNLDFGIEVCFSSHLDMFWKAMLQFAFPVYIWLLVAAIILASRYSTLAARVSGSNSVPVLATLFLLSYAKILDTVITAFSFTFIATERSSPMVVWLLDGNLKFLEERHIVLVLVSTLFALMYTIPVTVLLLLSPVLQRIPYYWVVNLVQKVKPLLDAYQGPFKDRYRWWPGLMLGARIVLVIALTTNTRHDPKLSAFIVVLVTLLLLLAKVFFGSYSYRSRLLSLLENTLLCNLIIFGLWCSLNHSRHGSNSSRFSHHQAGAAYTSIGITYTLLTAVIVHRAYRKMVDCGVGDVLMRLVRRKLAAGIEHMNQDVELRERQGSDYAPVRAPPTVTVVELREPLLTDN